MTAAAVELEGAPFLRELEAYLEKRFGTRVRVDDVRALGDDGGEKGFGYGVPIQISLHGAPERELVLHTVTAGRGGHDTLADRAAQALLAFETFNELPRHVRALDVGALLDDGTRVSLARARDFFFVTTFAEGSPYFHDLERIGERGLTDRDRDRVDTLASLLAHIHRERCDAPRVYERRLRQLVGDHECIAGLVDSYDMVECAAFTSRSELLSIERRCVEHRHRLKAFAHRLARVHGDFHPWNILFQEDERPPTLLDRSRGEYGEPADDVAALVINYLVRALQRDRGMTGPFAELWMRFFRSYLATTKDDELALVLPPYLAWRALVLASPLWYPSFEPALRRRIFDFIDAVLSAERFDFDRPEVWLQGRA